MEKKLIPIKLYKKKLKKAGEKRSQAIKLEELLSKFQTKLTNKKNTEDKINIKDNENKSNVSDNMKQKDIEDKISIKDNENKSNVSDNMKQKDIEDKISIKDNENKSNASVCMKQKDDLKVFIKNQKEEIILNESSDIINQRMFDFNEARKRFM